MTELNIYCLRPGNTSVWLPDYIMARFGLKRGDRLTAEQFDSEEIQSLLRMRAAAKKK